MLILFQRAFFWYLTIIHRIGGENIVTKEVSYFFGCSEVNITWLITSELANQRARKVLFTFVVYTKIQHNTIRLYFTMLATQQKLVSWS